MNVELAEHQMKAIKEMRNGCVLVSGTGNGKSRTAIGYFYFVECGGRMKVNGKGEVRKMTNPKPLYIITTAKKRDSGDWEDECFKFMMPGKKDKDYLNGIDIVVDSWNNIKKYKNVMNAFFIFDEQRLVGNGTWVKTFLRIAKRNHWILLSATPGDAWKDYIPLFVANGYFHSKTEFVRKHVVFKPYLDFPVIDHYVDTGYLEEIRDELLVYMDFTKGIKKNHIDILCSYDRMLYKKVVRTRWNVFKEEPIQEIAGLAYVLRRIVNGDSSRLDATIDIVRERKKVIIFYNFTYELEMLREMFEAEGILYKEWNGQKHEFIPETEEWVYLVQYMAGAEGWNCIQTDSMIFFSQNYSYRIMEQSYGRIDRMNTPFKELYYYHLISNSPIDNAISKAIEEKRIFNERKFFG